LEPTDDQGFSTSTAKWPIFSHSPDRRIRGLPSRQETGSSLLVKKNPEMATNSPDSAHFCRTGNATDDHHTLQEFRASVGAQWSFLSDPGRIVQKDLDIQEYTDPEHNPMIPHTFVLKPRLVIYSVYNGYWFWGRPSVVDLWHDLRAITSQIRPDWDLSAPGLREAWNAGDLSRFHGWNKNDRH
jgi:hypothetical protein